MKLSDKKRAHFIGVGGVSMSALSKLLLSYGWTVSGSDRAYSERLTELSELGCRVWVGEDPKKVGLPDLVVYSGAIKPDHPELAFCRCLGAPTYERGDFLRLVSENYGCTIAVAGTHGKTTATAMLTHLFFTAGKKFTAHIGGDAVDYGNFVRTGENWFLTEACEYRKSMLSLRPDLGVVLNAENDHPDTYRDLSEIYDAFDTYLHFSRLKIVCGDTPYYRLRQSHNDVITYGTGAENEYRAVDLKLLENGCYGFSVSEYGNLMCDIKLNVYGKHNVENALCCYTVARLNGFSPNEFVDGINTFRGVKRRFEKIGLCRGATVLSDYAHHPAEIRAALSAAREAFFGKIYAVFQPHTYSRTARLFSDFCRAFSDCDEAIVFKEYPARETPEAGKTAKELFAALEKEEKIYYDNLLDLAAYLQKKVAPGDVVLVLGAGDVDTLCKILTSTN